MSISSTFLDLSKMDLRFPESPLTIMPITSRKGSNGRTFFETARIILSQRDACPFHGQPYVLILSGTDKTIRNDRLLKFFQENVKKLKVVEVATDHYPVDVTRDYFRSRFPEEAVKEILLFFDGSASETA